MTDIYLKYLLLRILIFFFLLFKVGLSSTIKWDSHFCYVNSPMLGQNISLQRQSVSCITITVCLLHWQFKWKKNAMEIWYPLPPLPSPSTTTEVISKLTDSNPLDGCLILSFFLSSEKMEMPIVSESLPSPQGGQ